MGLNGYDALRDEVEPEVVSVDVTKAFRVSCAVNADGPAFGWEAIAAQGHLDEGLDAVEDVYIELLHAYEDLFGEDLEE